MGTRRPSRPRAPGAPWAGQGACKTPHFRWSCRFCFGAGLKRTPGWFPRARTAAHTPPTTPAAPRPPEPREKKSRHRIGAGKSVFCRLFPPVPRSRLDMFDARGSAAWPPFYSRRPRPDKIPHGHAPQACCAAARSRYKGRQGPGAAPVGSGAGGRHRLRRREPRPPTRPPGVNSRAPWRLASTAVRVHPPDYPGSPVAPRVTLGKIPAGGKGGSLEAEASVLRDRRALNFPHAPSIVGEVVGDSVGAVVGAQVIAQHTAAQVSM